MRKTSNSSDSLVLQQSSDLKLKKSMFPVIVITLFFNTNQLFGKVFFLHRSLFLQLYTLIVHISEFILK